MITKKKKENLIKSHGVSEKDTGSPEVQIALLTERITRITKHLKKNQKDFHTKRGLLQMVSARRRHLQFLKRKDTDRYAQVSEKFGLK